MALPLMVEVPVREKEAVVEGVGLALVVVEGVGAEEGEAAVPAAALAKSFQRLMGAIELPPLHILYASDGGNAEGLSKRIASEAR